MAISRGDGGGVRGEKTVGEAGGGWKGDWERYPAAMVGDGAKFAGGTGDGEAMPGEGIGEGRPGERRGEGVEECVVWAGSGEGACAYTGEGLVCSEDCIGDGAWAYAGNGDVE